MLSRRRKGEGQIARLLQKTFLSLTKQNKDDIPFVQGRFNCGGTGVLAVLRGAQIPAHYFAAAANMPGAKMANHQDAVGLHARSPPKAAPGRKSSMYVYLAPDGKS